MEDKLTKGAQTATQDLARRNKASTFSNVFTKFSDMNSQLVSIATSDKEEEYVPPPAARKAAVKMRPPVRAKAKHKEESLPVKEQRPKNDSVAVKTVAKTKPKPAKHLNGNNVQMSDLLEFAEAKWRDTFLPTLYDSFFCF